MRQKRRQECVVSLSRLSDEKLFNIYMKVSHAWHEVEEHPFVVIKLKGSQRATHRQILECKIANALYYLRYVRRKSARVIYNQTRIANRWVMELTTKYPWYPGMVESESN